MSEKPIETVRHQDGASSGAAAETGVATGAREVASTAAGETQADGGQPKQKTVEELIEERVSSLKGALDKERGSSKTSERERKKLAQQVAQLTAEIGSLRATTSRPDPKALQDQFYGEPTEFVTGRITESEQRIHRAMINERVESSREWARHQYEDFEEAEEAFIEAGRKNPELLAEADNSRWPALVAYKKGKELLSASGAKSPSEELAELRAEIAALKAGRDGGQPEAATETGAASAQKPSVARSNVGTRGSGVGSTTTFRGPTPSENVYGRHRQRRAQG